MTIEAFLARLQKVQQQGDRRWSARCPAHDDQKPSLSISLGENDRILVHCHARCTIEQICAALHIKVSDLFTEQGRPAKKKWGRTVAKYDYRDADWTLLYQIRRDQHKHFAVRRPTPNGGWINGLGDTRRVLYRLPDLIAADPDELVFIAEGEKDDDRLWDEDLVATTNPFGAGKWSKLSDDSVLDDRNLVIVPDNDGQGRMHALDVAQRRYGRSRTIRILELPDDAHDISEWFDAGGTKDQLLKLAACAPVFDGTRPEHWHDVAAQAEDDEIAESEDETRNDTKPSQATIMVELCDALEFFHDDDTAFASLLDNGRRLTWAVRSKQFKTWLSRRFYVTQGKAAASQAVANAISVLEGRALFEGPQIRAHLRVAQHGSCIYLDLADDEYRVVEINPDGWRICDDPPVRFRRTGAMRPLPMPERGGSLSTLRSYLNIGSDRDFVLACAWLVAAFRPDLPTPILTFSSEQGSGKTSAARILRQLIDPNRALIRAEPGTVRDLMVVANHSQVIAIDNSSNIPIWLSDALCRLSTGGGFATRMLYENDEEVVFSSLRPVILTGIEDIGSRSDLLDRMIRLSLPSIPEDRRKPERQLNAEFEKVHPFLLGALLDAVSMALRNIDSVELPTVPRMADFAHWIVAAEPALPWAPGEFMGAYCENREHAHELAIEASVIGEPVRLFAQQHGEWTGTATRLLELLTESQRGDVPKSWPRTAHHLSGQLRRLAPNLRELGVQVVFHERTRTGRSLTVAWEAPSSVTSVTERQRATPHGENGTCHDAGDARDADSPQHSVADPHIARRTNGRRAGASP